MSYKDHSKYVESRGTKHYKRTSDLSEAPFYLFPCFMKQKSNITLSAILWGSVACPRLARTLGRIPGGCGAGAGAAATGPDVGWL